MTQYNIKVLVGLIGNAFGIYTFKIFLDNFLVTRRVSKKVLFLAYLGYYIINTGIPSMAAFDLNPVFAMANTLILTFCVSLCYKATLKNQIIYSVFALVLSVATEVISITLIAAYLKTNYVEAIIEPVSFAVNLVMAKISFYILIKIICKWFSKADNFEVPLSYWMAVLTAPIGSLFIIYIIMEQSKIAGYQLTEDSTVAITLLLLINFLVFFLYERIIGLSKIKTQNALLSLQNTYYAKQYQIMEDSNTQTRQLRHDLKGHLSAIKTYADSGDIKEINGYIENLLGGIEYKGNFSNCGILAIDGIINLKMNEAARLGTKIDVTVNVPADLAINPVDITVILGNVLDNAVEACRHVGPGERFINVHLEYEKKSLFINVVNSCDDSLAAKSENGLLTTKRDKDGEIHGLGLNNVRSVAKKYNGTVTVDKEPQKFICSILLYSVENQK